MTRTHPEPSDVAVDELKRKARRRLIGAIVLALAAAVALPLLFESEPKPLGEDVSVQIPPMDGGKFVTPLSPQLQAVNDSYGSGAYDPASCTVNPLIVRLLMAEPFWRIRAGALMFELRAITQSFRVRFDPTVVAA